LKGVPLKTEASRQGKGYIAASGTNITNYGETSMIGFTDEWVGVTMKMQCADVKKTLGSVHRMNQGGNVVVLDGHNSYLMNKATGRKTRIGYEDGQYVMYLWVKSDGATKDDTRKVMTSNRHAALAVDDEDFLGQGN
jgi:hypothetical protein